MFALTTNTAGLAVCFQSKLLQIILFLLLIIKLGLTGDILALQLLCFKVGLKVLTGVFVSLYVTTVS